MSYSFAQGVGRAAPDNMMNSKGAQWSARW